MSFSSLPSTMRAVLQKDPNSTALVLEQSPLPPTSQDDDYLIKVYATAPCLGELSWQANYSHLFEASRPRVVCTEAAGVIAFVPNNAPQTGARFQVGDEVFFRAEPGRFGCLCEYTIAKHSELAHKPKSLSWTDAAATPLSSLTAWQGLFTHGTLDSRAIEGNLEAKQHNGKLRLLVTGASGGVGSWAVQFAAAAGAGAIVALCGSSSADLVRTLGATEIVDYTQESLDEWVVHSPATREVDLILDCTGGTTLASSWHALKRGGVLLSITGNPQQEKPISVTTAAGKAEWFLVKTLGRHLTEIARLIDQGKAVPAVDSVVEFADFQAAFDKVEGRKTKGKVVIKVAA